MIKSNLNGENCFFLYPGMNQQVNLMFSATRDNGCGGWLKENETNDFNLEPFLQRKNGKKDREIN